MRSLVRSTTLLAVIVALAACGSGDVGSGGSLTVPTTTPATSVPADTSPTTVPAPTSTAPDAQPTTTTTPPTTAPGPETSSNVTIFLLNEKGEAVAVERIVEGTAVARGAIEALIAGPTSSERGAGLSTAFPSDSLVLGLTIYGSRATVDMSLEFASGGGSASVLGRLAQLVYTLTEFGNVDDVRLHLEGAPVEHFSGEGVFVGEPLTRADFTGSVPIAADSPAAGAPTWDQGDLGDVLPGRSAARVVLVAADDYLNVRRPAGTEGTVIGRLLPGVAVETTAQTSRVGSSTWIELTTPAGKGWVNGFYLTAYTDDFPPGTDPIAVAEELADRMAAGEDFRSLISAKGLWVAHHAPPIRFDHDDLDGILSDPTLHRWGSNALDPGSPEIPQRTFRQAVANRFVSTIDDSDRETFIGEAIEGPNGRPPQFAIPTEFTGFEFVTFFDPGDNPEYGGLDWTTWMVSYSYEGDELKVVGLTLDEWAP